MLYLLLILFQTLMIYNGIFVFCQQIEGSAPLEQFSLALPLEKQQILKYPVPN